MTFADLPTALPCDAAVTLRGLDVLARHSGYESAARMCRAAYMRALTRQGWPLSLIGAEIGMTKQGVAQAIDRFIGPDLWSFPTPTPYPRPWRTFRRCSGLAA